MLRDTPHEVRVRYCNIDYDREIAIVAETTTGGKRKLLGVTRLSIEPDGKSCELAFIVGDEWQNLGLGTKIVDYTLEIAKEMGVENVYSIMLTDNYRAMSLTKKMGFCLEYLKDGTVKGTLDLKDEILEPHHPKISAIRKIPEAPKKEAFEKEKKQPMKEEAEAPAPT